MGAISGTPVAPTPAAPTGFAAVLAKINLAAQIAQLAEPSIALFSTDHVAATQQLLQITGASVSALGGTEVGQEATAAASLASNLVPLFFQLASLFHKKAATTPVAPVS